MVAMQLSSEPLVRQAVRQVYQTRSVISVTPTKKGKKVQLLLFINIIIIIIIFILGNR